MGQETRESRIRAINEFVQERLRITSQQEIRAVDAAKLLDEAGILNDSPEKRGRNLRAYLRDGVIQGAEYHTGRPDGKWFITPVDSRAERK